MKLKTVGNYNENEIILPSKMNGLTISEVELMWPEKKNIPLYPSGLIYKANTNRFELIRSIHGTKTYMGSSKDFLTALNHLIAVCERQGLKI